MHDTPKTEVQCAMFARIISTVKSSQESRQLISMLFKMATDNAGKLLGGFGVGAPPTDMGMRRCTGKLMAPDRVD